MATVTIQVGNTDHKLSQQEWHQFFTAVDREVQAQCDVVHFAGCSIPTAPWQNACWVGLVDHPGQLTEAVARIGGRFRQESIAVTVGETDLLACVAEVGSLIAEQADEPVPQAVPLVHYECGVAHLTVIPVSHVQGFRVVPTTTPDTPDTICGIVVIPSSEAAVLYLSGPQVNPKAPPHLPRLMVASINGDDAPVPMGFDTVYEAACYAMWLFGDPYDSRQGFGPEPA